VKKLKNNPKLEGILIARSQGRARVWSALRLTPRWARVLFGTGGVDIELMKDVALAALRSTKPDAKELISRPKPA